MSYHSNAFIDADKPDVKALQPYVDRGRQDDFLYPVPGGDSQWLGR